MSKMYKSLDEVKSFANHVDNSCDVVANAIIRIMKKRYSLDEKEDACFDLMLDVGCGSGGSTRLFADYFKSIIAFDPSENQIVMAKKIACGKNIKFVLGSGENMPAIDESADVIISCFALQYMDIANFTSECKRVLKQRGQAFAFGYDCSDVATVGEGGNVISGKKALDRFFRRNELFFQENRLVKHSWFDKYQSIFDSITQLKKSKIDDISDFIKMSLLEFKLSLLAIPEYKLCLEGETERGMSDPLDDLMQDLKKIWEVRDKDESQIMIRLTRSYFIICLER